MRTALLIATLGLLVGLGFMLTGDAPSLPATAKGEPDVTSPDRAAPPPLDPPATHAVRAVLEADEPGPGIEHSVTDLTGPDAMTERILVLVTSREGALITGARVRIAPDQRASASDRSLDGAVSTNEAGRARIPVPATGTYHLTVEARGYVPVRRGPVRPGDTVLVSLARGKAQQGLVVDAWTGSAVADALILVDGAGERRTDRGGRFVVSDVEDSGTPIEILAAGYRSDRFVLSPALSPTTIYLEPGPKVAGRVRTDDGRALTGASITLLCERSDDEERNTFLLDTTTSDPAGRFEISVATDDDAWVVFEADGFLSERIDAEDLGDQVEVTLVAANGVVGAVRLSGGGPASGAIVRLFGVDELDASERRVRADSDGKFVFHAVRGGPLRVGAAHPEGTAVVMDFDPLRRAEPLLLELPAPTRVEGTVTLSGITPAPFAEVSFDHADDAILRISGLRDRLRADASGRFTLSGLPCGAWHVSARHGDAVGDAALTVIPGRTPALEISLAARSVVTGVVVDSAGVAISGARVRAKVDVPEERAGSIDREALADHEGHFRLCGFLPGDAPVLTVDADGFLRQSAAAVVSVDHAPLRIVLDRSHALHGRVFDAVTRRPVERFAIELTVTRHDGDSAGSADETWKRGFQSAVGQLNLEGLPTGAATLTARANGYFTYGPVQIEIGDALAPLEIGMQPAAEIHGRLVDAGGRPIDGAFARLTPDGMPDDRRPRKSRSRPDGRFRIRDLEPGRYQLTVGRAEDPDMTKPVTALPGTVDVGDLRISRVARIQARVVDEQGRPAPRHQVYACGRATGAELTALTDGEGVATFFPVLTDDYEVRCGGVSIEAHAPTAGTANVEITLDEPPGDGREDAES